MDDDSDDGDDDNDDGDCDGDGDGDGDDEDEDEDDESLVLQGVTTKPLKLFSYQMTQISKNANFTLSLNYFQSLYQPLENVQSLSPHVCIVYN